MSEIARAGVDEIISSWWGLGSPEADWLPARHASGLKHRLDVAVHLEPYEKWQRTRAIVEADFEYLRGLGVGRVYIYYPFDGLIPMPNGWSLGQFPSIELYAQTSDAVRAAQAGFDGVHVRHSTYAVRGGAFAGFCKRATRRASPARRRSGRATTQLAPRRTTACAAAGQAPRTTACGGRRSPPTPTESRSPATTSGTRHQIEPAWRRAPTIYGEYASYEGAYVQGCAPSGRTSSHGALDGDVPRRGCRRARARRALGFLSP